MDELQEFFRRDKFAEHCGIELLEVSSGHARAKMHLKEHHLNGLRMAHGGAIFTLADLTFAAACNSHGTVAVAINANVSFVKAVNKGTLYADAREVSISPRISSYTIHITDDSKDIVAIFQGMAYRKKETLKEVITE